MLLIGLTGSIATGKSTVSALLSQPPYSLPLIDADLLARQVVEPGTSAYRRIVAHFAPTTPDLLLPPTPDTGGEHGPTGHGRPLNRPALGRRVFGSDPATARDRAVLNAIVHPAVRWAMAKAVLRAYLRGCWAVVLDVPLLFEAGLDRFCGVVMVVAVRDPRIQMERLRARDPHLTEGEARSRVGSQGDVREKARRAEGRGSGAGVVVWNDGGREELEKEVGRVMREVEGRHPRWWAWLLLLVPPLGALVALRGLVMSWLAARRWEAVKKREKAKL